MSCSLAATPESLRITKPSPTVLDESALSDLDAITVGGNDPVITVTPKSLAEPDYPPAEQQTSPNDLGAITVKDSGPTGEGTQKTPESFGNEKYPPSIANGNITAWKNSADLTPLHDSDIATCAVFSSDDSVLLLVQTDVFTSIKLRVHTENVAVDTRSCSAPLIVAAHNSNLSLGKVPCRPICIGLLRCQRVDKTENALGSHEFRCHCEGAKCRGVVLVIEPSAAINAKHDVKICHIQSLA